MRTGHLEMAIDLYTKMVYEDAKKGRADLRLVGALDALVRSWALVQAEKTAMEAEEEIRKIAGKGPEIPIPFKPSKKAGAV